MRRALTVLLTVTLVLGSSACSDDPSPTERAQARICDARSDLDEEVSGLVADVRAGNLGVARDRVDDVQAHLTELREAVGDLGQAQREAVAPHLDAVNETISALQLADLADLGAVLDSIRSDLNAALAELSAAADLDC